MYSVIKEFVLPPGSLWLFFALAFGLILCRKRIAGLSLFAVALVLFYLLATPVIAARLSSWVQTVPPISESALRASGAQAIVILSAGLHFDTPEYGGATVDETTLERIRYGARLHRLTGLPILVSGGRPPGARLTLAKAMADSLAADFGIPGVLMEDRSLDTFENAAFSARILMDADMRKVLLVTHASHMDRAARAFSAAGIEVVPAPTIFVHGATGSATDFIPRLSGLRESHYAIYELAGRAWYALRH